MSEPMIDALETDAPLAKVLKFPARIKDSLTTPMSNEGLRVAICECGQRHSFAANDDGFTEAAMFMETHSDHMVIIPPLADRTAML